MKTVQMTRHLALLVSSAENIHARYERLRQEESTSVLLSKEERSYEAIVNDLAGLNRVTDRAKYQRYSFARWCSVRATYLAVDQYICDFGDKEPTT